MQTVKNFKRELDLAGLVYVETEYIQIAEYDKVFVVLVFDGQDYLTAIYHKANAGGAGGFEGNPAHVDSSLRNARKHFTQTCFAHVS